MHEAVPTQNDIHHWQFACNKIQLLKGNISFLVLPILVNQFFYNVPSDVPNLMKIDFPHPMEIATRNIQHFRYAEFTKYHW